MSTAEKLDRLSSDQLKSEIPYRAVIGREIIVLEQVGSTNDAVLEIASQQGAALCQRRRSCDESGTAPCPVDEGLVVFAEHQTAGRGQHGSSWESTAGKGLWFSILLRPRIKLSDSGQLTIWAIEAIADVMRTEYNLDPIIKLPNDIQLLARKVAGVLVEMRAQNKARHVAVVGIGINVNQCRDDFPVELQDRAISLAMALGQQVERHRFAITLLRKLDLTYREKFGCTQER